jgi:hypothetical protein
MEQATKKTRRSQSSLLAFRWHCGATHVAAANRPRADACGFGDGLRRPPALDLPYNPLSTARRQPGILMDVHPVLPRNLESEASATSASSVKTGWTT